MDHENDNDFIFASVDVKNAFDGYSRPIVFRRSLNIAQRFQGWPKQFQIGIF